MKLNDKVYNVLKWVLLIVVPAFTTMLSGIGSVLSIDMTTVTALIGIISTFCGAVIGISTKNYNASITTGDISEEKKE